MAKNKTPVLIDVDLTVVDSGSAWLSWMEELYQDSADRSLMLADRLSTGHYDYDLSRYFSQDAKKAINPFEFWEDPYLYDRLTPWEGSQAAIEKIRELGHPVRFVSYCKRGHLSSKIRFLRKYYPFVDMEGGDGCGFYATKYKAGVAGGVIIDDRNKFLNQFDSKVYRIKFESLYSQDAPDQTYDLITPRWEDISRAIEKRFS